MALFSRKPRPGSGPKTVVLGLDGVPFGMLRELCRQGITPALARIIDSGRLSAMQAPIPEISSVSWTTFLTGENPGGHGIFGFVDLAPGSYKMVFPNFSQVRAETVTDALARMGKRSVLLNVPSTYPARPLEGAMVSGFVAVDLARSVYPAPHLAFMQKAGYRVDVETTRARNDPDFLFADLAATLAAREAALDYLWDAEAWDLFCVVVTGTDRLLHYQYAAWEDENHPRRADFLDYFRKVDAFAGRIYDRFAALPAVKQGLGCFFALSDHGFCGARCEVRINRWLAHQGYLTFAKDDPKSIMDIGQGSRAFALDPCRIHINRAGKYPLGCVSEQDAPALRKEIAEALAALTAPDGEKVFRKVLVKEDLYSGPYADRAPDIAAVAMPGFDVKGRVAGSEVFLPSELSGMHTQDDAFFFDGRGKELSHIQEAKERILSVFREGN
ncbi:MAG: alkaline phosphatase family protein [Thermodesulfobacteriota bacterium]